MPLSKRKAAGRDLHSPNRVLKSNSRISSGNIHGFLLDCINEWEVLYSEDEKRQIIETLPSNYRAVENNAQGKLKFPLAAKYVREDPFLKKGVERLRSDIDDGFYEPPWQYRAEKASKKRREGGFDNYIQTNIKEKFGTTPIHSSGHQEDEGDRQQKKDHIEHRGRNRTLRLKLENGAPGASPNCLSREQDIVADV